MNIHKSANYASMIVCVFDNVMKGLGHIFLSTNFSNLSLKAAEILMILYTYPFVNHIFNFNLVLSIVV